MGNGLPNIRLPKDEAEAFDVFEIVKKELLQCGFQNVRKLALVDRVPGITYLYCVNINDRIYALKISFEQGREKEMTLQIPQSIYTVPCIAAGTLGTEPNMYGLANYYFLRIANRNRFTYLVLDWIPEGNLEGQVLSEDEALDVLWCCCKALAAMHDRKIIHRDVKPGNILKRTAGHYVLADYGITRKKDSKLLTSNLGTPGFIASEVKSDARKTEYSYSADIYSLGMTILSLLPKMGVQAMTPVCSVELHDLLQKMISSDPLARPTAHQILQHTLLRKQRNRRLQQMMRDFKQIVTTIQNLSQATEEARSLRQQLILLIDDLQMAAPNIDNIIALLEEKNQLPPGIPFEKQGQLLVLLDFVGNTVNATYAKLMVMDQQLPDLEKRLHEMKDPLLRMSQRSKVLGMALGGPGGIVAGGTVGAGLVVAPILGASGAFVLAGVAFPPVLIIGGAALVIGGLSVVLGRIIADAVQKKKIEVLAQIGQVLKAVKEMKDVHQDLSESLLRVSNVFKNDMVRSAVASTGAAPDILRQEKEKWDGYQNRVVAVQFPQVDYTSVLELVDEAINNEDAQSSQTQQDPPTLGSTGPLQLEEDREFPQCNSSDDSIIIDDSPAPIESHIFSASTSNHLIEECEI